jgi:hypothetical protein
MLLILILKKQNGQKEKGKAITVEAWTGLEGSRRLTVGI